MGYLPTVVAHHTVGEIPVVVWNGISSIPTDLDCKIVCVLQGVDIHNQPAGRNLRTKDYFRIHHQTLFGSGWTSMVNVDSNREFQNHTRNTMGDTLKCYRAVRDVLKKLYPNLTDVHPRSQQKLMK
jgi:hypothetical protein